MKFSHASGRARKFAGMARLLFAAALIIAAFFPNYEARSALLRTMTDTLSSILTSSGSNHTIKFRTSTGVDSSADQLKVSFDTGFTVSGLDFGDVDLSHGPVTGAETEETLAAAAAAGTWGASFSGQILTLTAPTDAGGSEIAASDFLVIEIGTNATAQTGGDTQITNPSSSGSYRVFVGGSFGDEGSVAVSIVTSNQTAVSAEVSSGQAEGSGGGPPPPPPPPPPPDVTPPVISNIAVSDITSSSAKITWTTNEPANSLVDYGPTVAYGQTSGDSLTLVYNHTVVIGGLSPSTLYHFRVRSADGSANEAVSGDNTFTTSAGIDNTAPVISNITVLDITGSRATVNWTTDEPSTSVVEYGPTNAYGTAASDPALVISHSITIIGPSSDTLYHFRVRSTDASNNEAFSPDNTFRTRDVTPPIISGIAVTDITETSARVVWTTDEPATSRVDYGLTSSYGSAASDGTLVTSHSALLTGLVAGTTYHFRVISADSSQNSVSSPDQTFVTAPDATPPPNVSNFRAVLVTDTIITLAWEPPQSSDYAGVRIQMSQDAFPAGPGSGITIYDGSGTTRAVSNLIPESVYYFTAFAYDAARNYASGALTSATTLAAPTPPPPPPPAPEVPPEIPPAAPPEVLPEAPEVLPVAPSVAVPSAVTVPAQERVSLTDVRFLVAGRTLELGPQDSRIRALSRQIVTVSLKRELFVRPPLRVILNVGPGSYLVEENVAGTTFEAVIGMPAQTGLLPAALIIQYADGTEDAVQFFFLIDPYGIVFERQNGVKVPVAGARVTLYEHNGQIIVWDANVYSQQNPQKTAADGYFAFFVPPGSYHLEAEKDGYRKGETPIFEVRDTIVNRDIEIFRIPPPLQEVIKPEAPLAENIAAVAKNIGQKTTVAAKVAQQEVKKVIDNPKVEEANETVAAPAIVSVALVNATAAAGFAQIIGYLQFLFTQPLLLLERKKRRGWGVVYHSLSKLPIDLAIVRLVDFKTGRPVATRVTDKQGRYAFIAPAGSYKLEVAKTGFVFPTVLLSAQKEDAGYLDLYHAEEIVVSEDGATITANIPLDPIEKEVAPKAIVVKKYLKLLNKVLAFSGIIWSVASFVISPRLLFGALVAVQIALFLLFRRLAVAKKPKTWGIVYDEKTRDPLRYAVARIFEITYNKLLETQVTDARGRYNFLVGRSKYYVTYEKPGYEKKTTDVFDFTAAAKPEAIAKDVGLKKI